MVGNQAMRPHTLACGAQVRESLTRVAAHKGTVVEDSSSGE